MWVQCQWRRLTLFSQSEVYFGYPKNQKHEIVLSKISDGETDFESFSDINENTEPTIAKTNVHIQNLKEFRFAIPKREQNFYLEIEQLSEKQIFASMDKVLILYFAEIFRRVRLSNIYLHSAKHLRLKKRCVHKHKHESIVDLSFY